VGHDILALPMEAGANPIRREDRPAQIIGQHYFPSTAELRDFDSINLSVPEHMRPELLALSRLAIHSRAKSFLAALQHHQPSFLQTYFVRIRTTEFQPPVSWADSVRIPSRWRSVRSRIVLTRCPMQPQPARERAAHVCQALSHLYDPCTAPGAKHCEKCDQWFCEAHAADDERHVCVLEEGDIGGEA
jgi:hypothetical protein